MAQLHFTLDSDFFVGLFSETKDEAFGKLMEALLNQVLQAESTEQLGAFLPAGGLIPESCRFQEESSEHSVLPYCIPQN